MGGWSGSVGLLHAYYAMSLGFLFPFLCSLLQPKRRTACISFYGKQGFAL